MIIINVNLGGEMLSNCAPTDDRPTGEVNGLCLDFNMKEMTAMQAAYWLGRQKGSAMEGLAAHLYAEFDGRDLNREALSMAVRALYAKHPMLRLAITAEGLQHILPLSACHQLTVEDIARYSKPEAEQFLHNKRERMSHQILDLNQSSPIEISVTLLANNEHRLHIDADMIACDAQSFRIVVEDLARLYLSAQETDLAMSEEPQITYFHYLDHQQADRYLAQRKASDKQWWQARLSSLPPEPPLPYLSHQDNEARPQTQRLAHQFTHQERVALEALAKEHHLTLTQLFLALFSQVIATGAREHHFRLNVPTFHRGIYDPQIEQAVGDFSNLLIFSAHVDKTQTLLSHCHQVANQLNLLLSHETYSGVQVMRDLSRLAGQVQRSPVVFTSGMDIDGGELFSQQVTDSLGRMNWVISQGAQVTLDAQIAPAYGGILANWDVRVDLLEQKVIEPMFAHYVALIRRLATFPQIVHQTLEQLDAALGQSESENIAATPLSNLQKSYLLGRSTQIALGGVAMHEFREYRGNLATETVRENLTRLVEQIPALRTHIDQDKLLQFVSPIIELNLKTFDFQHLSREKALLAVEPLREHYRHKMHDLSGSPWEVCVVQLPPEYASRINTIIFTSFDALIVDGRSHSIILATLLGQQEDGIQDLLAPRSSKRQGPAIDTAKRAQDERYWQEKLHRDCLPPALPWKQPLETIRTSRYARESLQIRRAELQQLTLLGAENGLFVNSLLTAVIVQVLACWTTENGMRIGFPVVIPQQDELAGNESTFVILEHEKSDASVLSQALDLQSDMLEALEHLDFSGVDVNRLLMNGSSPALALPVVITNGLSWQTLKETDDVALFSGVTQTPQMALDIRLTYDEQKNLIVSFDYAVDALETNVVCDILNALKTLLQQLSESQQGLLPSSSFLDLSHYRLNSDETHRDPSDFLSHIARQLFDETNEKTAIICGETTVSYAELGSKVACVMGQLNARGLQQGSVVAICLPRSVEHLVMTLACSLSGMVWVPIDASSPHDRLAYLLSNCNAELVVTQHGDVVASVAFSELLSPIASEAPLPSDEQLSCLSQSTQTAYYLYTSGTTGKPKCVVVNNQATSNVIGQTCREWSISSQDVIMSVTPYHHDMSVFDVFAAFSSGATLVLPGADGEKDALKWNQLIENHKVTIWVSVPAILEMLLSCTQGSQLQSLRLVAQGGDYIKPATIAQLRALESSIRLISLGGPTETTIWSIWHELTDADVSTIPYGRPLPGNRYFILDERQQHVPQGVVGRIYTVGVNLAQGYLENGELKQTDFVTIYDDRGEPVRAFRTGDQGYYRQDGNIIFASRVNGYVKVRGVRVSLPDIEKELLKHPLIANAVVVDYLDGNGDSALAALFTLNSDKPLTAQQLRQFAQQCLPQSHIPTHFMPMTILPLSANGKVDRKQCQARVAASLLPSESGTHAEREKGEVLKPTLLAQIEQIYRQVIATDEVFDDAQELALLSRGLLPSHLVSIASLLNQRFASQLSASQLVRCQSAQQVAALLA